MPISLASARWASAVQVTLLGCKVGVMNRLPASFFVSVAYNCWAYRRQGVLLNAETGEIKDWIYPSGSDTPMKLRLQMQAAEAVTEQAERREVVLNTPISRRQIRSLKVGDIVIINGEMHTGRDALHQSFDGS